MKPSFRPSLSSLSYLLLATFVLLAISGCTNNDAGAASAIEAYIQALEVKNADRLTNLSCGAWEANAKTELDSFAAVSVTLIDMNCKETEKEGEYTLVSCSGIIAANYNGEILEINLADRTYQVVYEAGEWRMCGYH